MDDFNRKRHAVYKLTYHAVFVIKYRRKVMSEPIIDHMRQYATHLIEQCYQGRLIELNGEPDHIHILFELPATAAPSVVVCSLKTQLSKEIFPAVGFIIPVSIFNVVDLPAPFGPSSP